MYSKKRAQQITKNDVKFIPAGIQENVALKSARVAESPTGRKFFEVVFEKNLSLIHISEPTRPY